MPEAEVVWVRDSTGVITARFLAEKDNPRADMVMGLAASSLIMFEKAGLLETYKPQGADGLKEIFRDGRDPYTWTGMDAYLGVVCFNTAEAGKDKIATPTSWKDLTNPALKGKVVMPHPASSGTGYLMVAGWLQSMGEAGGLEVHGRPAREHRRLSAFGLGARACRRRAANASPASPSTCAAPPRRARARRSRS